MSPALYFNISASLFGLDDCPLMRERTPMIAIAFVNRISQFLQLRLSICFMPSKKSGSPFF